MPVMLGELLLAVPSAFSVLFDPTPFIVVGVVATAAVAGLVITMWSDLGEDERRALRWLAVGAVACIVISVGGFPGSRLLLFPSIGGLGVVGAPLRHRCAPLRSGV